MHPQIIGIHPIDGDLRFLKRMCRELKINLQGDYRHVKISNNIQSHRKCVQLIMNACRHDNILFLCHGRSDGILGCRYLTHYPSHPKRYDHGLLVPCAKLEIFRDKKIFCVACDSNDYAKKAVEEGARVFVGFKNIYFDEKKYSLIDGCPCHEKVVRLAKYKFRNCIKSAISYAWLEDLTYNQCVSHLKLLINKTNDSLIAGHKTNGKNRILLRAANSLQLIKEGIRVWGDGNLTFRD